MKKLMLAITLGTALIVGAPAWSCDSGYTLLTIDSSDCGPGATWQNSSGVVVTSGCAHCVRLCDSGYTNLTPTSPSCTNGTWQNSSGVVVTLGCARCVQCPSGYTNLVPDSPACPKGKIWKNSNGTTVATGCARCMVPVR